MIHYFGIDESCNSDVYRNREKKRPFTLVLCHSVDSSEVIENESLLKDRAFNRRNLESNFLYSFTWKDFTSSSVMVNLFADGYKRFCSPPDEICVYCDGDRQGSLLNEHLIRYISASISPFFNFCWGRSTRYPILRRADNLANIISFYHGTSHDYEPRKSHFRRCYPTLDARLKKCLVDVT